MTVDETVSFAEFARILGCKPQAVTALRHAGRLVLSEDKKRVQVQPSLARIEATSDPSKAAVAHRHAEARGAPLATGSSSEDDAADDSALDDPAATHDYQTARARREHFQAMEAQRAYEVAIGKLMDAGEVASAVSAAAVYLRSSLERLPDVLGPQLAALGDESQCRALLAESIEQALSETARRFNALAKVAA